MGKCANIYAINKAPDTFPAPEDPELKLTKIIDSEMCESSPYWEEGLWTSLTLDMRHSRPTVI